MYGSVCVFLSDIFMVLVALIQAFAKKMSAVKKTPFSAPLKAVSKWANAKYLYIPSFKLYAFVLCPGIPQY